MQEIAGNIIHNKIMKLSATKSIFPFLILLLMIFFGLSTCIFIFLKSKDFSFQNIILNVIIFIFIFTSILYLALSFVKLQSVSISDYGIESLVWIKETKFSIPFKMRKTIIPWKQVKKIEVRAHVIFFHGCKNKIELNTYFFNDHNEVIDFINLVTHAQEK